MDSEDDGTERIIDALIQQVQDNTICVGQGNFFEVDYAFVFQVKSFHPIFYFM